MSFQEPNGTGTQPTLESWKEIAAYLQRDAKTARRWEKEEGLPVRRHSHSVRSSVYAYPSELDAWRAARTVVPERAPVQSKWRHMAATLILSLVSAGSGVRYASAQSSPAPAKRLCTNCRNVGLPVAVTPDGRYLAAPSLDGRSVAILTLANGRVANLAGAEGQKVEWAIFSDDQKRVLFRAWVNNRAELRIVENRPGAASRVLPLGPYDWTGAIGWTKNSGVVMYAERADNTSDLVVLDPDTGGFRVLKELGWRALGTNATAALSPDGRYLAYSALATNPKSGKRQPNETEYHVYVLAMNGSGESEVVKTAGANRVTAWSADGNHLLYVSDVGGSSDLWAIRIGGGNAEGTATRVMRDMGRSWPIGMTASGSFLAQERQEELEYATVRMVDGTGVALEFAGAKPSLSPDGKSVAFKRPRPGLTYAYDVFVRSLETGSERSYVTGTGRTGNGVATWFHDGKGLLSGFVPNTGENGFHRLDLATGEWMNLRLGEGLPHALTKDDRTLYGVRRGVNDPQARDRIVALDTATGRERLVYTADAPGDMNIALSPDERTLAVRRNDSSTASMVIGRVSVDGSDYRELHRARLEGASNNLAWTDHGIQFTQQEGREYRLLQLPPEGGDPAFTGIRMSDLPLSIRFSEDGTRLAYSTMKSGVDVWIIDGIMSALK
jgi:hypothetical protein